MPKKPACAAINFLGEVCLAFSLFESGAYLVRLRKLFSSLQYRKAREMCWSTYEHRLYDLPVSTRVAETVVCESRKTMHTATADLARRDVAAIADFFGCLLQSTVAIIYTQSFAVLLATFDHTDSLSS